MRLLPFLAALLLALPALAAEPSSTVLSASPSPGRMDQAATLSASVGVGYSTATPRAGKLAAGYGHSCAVTAAGGVRCWGGNKYGQLGDGGMTDQGFPVAVKGVDGSGVLNGVTAVAVGGYHSCALLSAGTAVCWGFNEYGQLGSDTGGASKFKPIAVPGVSGAIAIAAGDYHTCALTGAGKVVCWGWNNFGQVGNGMAASQAVAPTTVVGLSAATAIAAGGNHACALLSGGYVFCWGGNSSGQVGKGMASAEEPSPIPVRGIGGGGILIGATAIAAGVEHSCAVLAGGKVACWGDNDSAQLGDGSGADQPFPVAVKGPGGTGALSGMAAVDAGGYHSCATTAAGGVYCWGDGGVGQLGAPAPNGVEPTPVAVSGLPAAVSSLTAGEDHTCAILADGRLTCWGYRGVYGTARLGDGVAGQRPVPAPVIAAGSPLGGSAVASGSDFTCAIVSGGVRCWGHGANGALGNGKQAHSAAAVTVSLAGTPLSGIVELVAGEDHACARRDDGTVTCWGDNSYGQVGSGTTVGQLAPVIVALGGPATGLAAGVYHSCAVLAGGTARCWGNNNAGQLGIGSKESTATPTLVQGLDGVTVTAITAGSSHTCALVDAGAATGAVRCWGSNTSGQLGNPNVAGSTTPVETDTLVGGQKVATSISAGSHHTCVGLTVGTAMCWGKGGDGQIGQDAYQNATSPVPVKGVGGAGSLSGVVAVAAGDYHSCARLSTGALRCWGANDHGQLGNGQYEDAAVPVAVLASGGAELDIAQVSPGGSHTCAVATAGGTLSCWGSRSRGQLGDGLFGYSVKPVLAGPKATGTVTFRDKGKVIGTATLVNGVATLKKKLAAGLHSLTASYAGGPAFAASTSKAVSHLVTGSPGADTITGTSGKDTLKGMAGADRIRGGGGDDVLDGGAGDDVVEGGPGRDSLTGGTGRDRFVFRRASDSRPARPDTITDFRAGDRIDLSAFDIKPKTKKIDRFTRYLGKGRFTGRAGEVRFDARRRALEGDVNGDRKADFRVLLTGVKTLRASAVKLR